MTAEAVDAFVWGYPLVVMHRTRALLCSRLGPGRMVHRDQLATPLDRAVVAPNNDTLYSSGWFDLRSGDVVVDVPPMDRPDRYWSVMLLDAYTHVAYVSRRHYGCDGSRVRLTLDAAHEAPRGITDVLPIATPTVWVLVRVLVDGPQDLEAARALQRAITVTPLGNHPSEPTIRQGRPNQVHTAGAAFYDELRAAIAVDPPAQWHPPCDPGARRVIDGDHDLTEEALAGAVDSGERRLRTRGLANDATANGWGTRMRGADFGDDLLLRAATAKFVLAAHHPAENRSYNAIHDAAGQPLDGRHPLALTFASGGEPPSTAFWSLTAYGPDMYLVDNEIDRWSIGDRTPGLRRAADGGLTITVGGPRPAEDGNWLPAPEGSYRLGLRVYEGLPEVVDATWFPPPLVPLQPTDR